MREQSHMGVTPTLVRVLSAMRGLLVTQAQMARREVAQNLRSVRAGLVLLAGALLFGLVSVHALGVVAVLALRDLGLETGTAALIVLLTFLAITLILGVWAMRCLSAQAVLPQKTMASLKSDLLLFEEAHHGREDDEKS